MRRCGCPGVHRRAMTEPTVYEIELRGHVGSRSLRPLIDDFSIDRSSRGITRLVGGVLDAAHLHGVLAHLATVNVEIISVKPINP